jgi:D-alanyl-lipoteichoic acid acyltransferase DltB (MBOAT superfamily)
VFVVSGVWHGANWTFLVWGALFGVLYLIENGANKYFRLKKNEESYSFINTLLALKTFILVSFIWVFFRSPTIQDALHMFQLLLYGSQQISDSLFVPLHVWLLLAAFVMSDIMLYNKRFDTAVGSLSFPLRWGIYSLLVFCIIVFAGVENFPFIYFQF